LSRQLKISGIVGLAMPFLTFGFILSAVASWSQFSWINNALSDLGVQNGITAMLFNAGLVISGFLFIIFAAGLFRFFGNNFLGKVGGAVFVFACVMLIAIGIFNEHFKPTHYLVSVGFFVLMPISLLILVVAFWVDGKHNLSVFTFALALIAAAVWVFEFTVQYVPGVAVPEFVSGLAGAAWVMVLGYLMLKKFRCSTNSEDFVKKQPPSVFEASNLLTN
jgi:hypothetical membrane protein